MKPDWFDEWVIPETDNWHLKPGAPDYVKKEFAELMGESDPDDGSAFDVN